MNVREFSLPLARPLRTAAGIVERREGFLVRVGDGVGEATPLPGWTESFEQCRAALEEAAAAEGEALDALGGAPAARHGLALALADRDAHAEGVPLYRHLGGCAVEDVPVNATVGDAGPADTAEAARAALGAGFGCLKVKVGARGIGADAERLRRVREVAPDAELRADANGAWSRREARAAFDAFADAGLEYVEQPLAPEDLAGHADLRGGPVGVALDEALAAHDPGEVVGAGAADVLVLKPMVLGGVDRALSVARDARAAGIEPVVTTTVDGAVARTAAVHLAAALAPIRACGLATADRLERDLAPDPAPVEDGRIAVPREPGTGVHVE